MSLMFADQFAFHITTLIFVLRNAFCDFDQCYFLDCKGERDRAIYSLTVRKAAKLPKY